MNKILPRLFYSPDIFSCDSIFVVRFSNKIGSFKKPTSQGMAKPCHWEVGVIKLTANRRQLSPLGPHI
jgi:hypothetical protein